MSVFEWLGRPGRPSSPPESSHVGGGHSPSRRHPNASDSLDGPSARGVAACAGSVARRLRPVLAAALLSLPLFAGLATEAAAQSAVECSTANTDGSYSVPVNWALKPSGVAAGAKFRLLFITSTRRDATATDIATYNTFVQTRAKAGHSAISDNCGNLFKVVGSTSTVDARDNTGTTGTGVEIYWLNGNRLANNYADFYDGSWDDYGRKNESGGDTNDTSVATGSNDDGTKATWFFGNAFPVVTAGTASSTTSSPFNTGTTAKAASINLYGLSPVFKVAGEAPPPPTAHIGMRAVQSGAAVDDTRITHAEDAGALTVRVGHTLEPERTSGVGYDITFNYYVRDSGGRHAESGFKSAVLPAGQSHVDLTIPIRENSEGGDGDTTVNILLMGGKGYVADFGNLTYDIQDGPDTGPSESLLSHIVWIVADSAGEDRTEGENLTFQIRLGGPTAALVPFTVHLKVEESGGGDFVAAGDEGRKTVRVERGQSSVGFRVPTAKDGERELDSRVTVSLTDADGRVPGTTTLVSPGGGGSYIVSTDKTAFDSVPPPPVPDSIQPYQFPPMASVTVVDLNPQREVSFASGSPLEVQENDEDWVNLTVNVVPPPAESFVLNFDVSGSATFKSDYDVLAGLSGNRGSLRVPANAGSVTVPVKIIDDSIEDDGETIVVRLLDSGPYEPSDPDSVTLTIRNHDGVPGTPEITVAAGADVTEGGDATFTLTADPAPTAPLDVSVTIAAEGAFGITAGQRTVTIPVTGSHELTLATDNDGTDEPDGSVTATVQAGTGYTVGATSSDTVAIADDDAPVTPVVDNTLPAAHPVVKHASLVKSFYDRLTAKNQHGDGVAGGWNKRFLKAMGHPDYVDYPQAAVTVADATRIWNHGGPGANTGWDGTVAAVTYAEQYFAGTTTPPPAPDPEITVAAGSGVTEGAGATFTITANPAPDADLAVTLNVAEAQGSDFVAASDEGARTVTILAGETTATLTVATDNDDVDEPNGSVTATVQAGTGYTVGTASSGTVAIADDDAPVTPVVDNTLPADHPVVKHASVVDRFHDGLTARNQHGDGAAGGWNKRFLKAMGHPDYVDYPQAAVTVADATKLWNHGGPGANTAWDGTVAAVTYAEQYFAGQVTTEEQNTPDPVPVPEIAIAAGSAVTEGGDATFTLTATPPPAAALEVTVTVAVSGDYGITAGERTVTIPTTGAYTLTLATAGDEADEPDGSVTATVDAGTGYTVGTASSGTVAIADDDLPVPEIAIAAGAGVTEGAAATFTLTATPPPAAALQVTVTVATSGDYGITAGERTVTIPTSGSTTLTLATTGDGTDEPDGSVTATVDAGTGYTVGAASSGTVAIADDDLPPPAVSVAAKVASITEGGDAVFTVTADRAVDANLAVTLNVTEAAGSDFVAAAAEGAKTATILAGKTSATLTVRTEDDTVDEPDGSVTATVDAGTGYTVGTASSGTVAVADNDAAGQPMVSLDDATAREGQTMQFPVRLSAAAKRDVWVRVLAQESNPVSARAGRDFQGPYYSAMVRIRAGQTVGQFGVRIHDDSHDDGGETFEAHVLFVMNGVAGVADGVAVGTIENDDPLPAAYLARFGRTVAEQALDGIAGRMSASRTPGMQGTVAGQALSFDPAASGQPAANGATPGSSGASDTVPADRNPAMAMASIARGLGADASAPGSASAAPGSAADPFGERSGAGLGDSRFGTPSLQSRSMTARDALLGSSFSLTAQNDGAGGSLAFWGRASQASFDGAERGDGTDIRLDGTVTTGMLGADYARGNWLVGLALTQSSSEGSYAAIGGDPCPDTDGDLCDGAVRAGDGDVEASLTAAIPYAALQVSERLKLWGAAGYGTGEVTLKTMEESYKADTSWTMAAAGVRGDLLAAPEEGSGPALALTSDALWARTSSDRTRDLAATDSDATRLRLGLEGSYRMALEGGGHLTPKLEIGARHDGGDAETGFGVEVGGGIAWVDPGLGLSLDVSGRTLLAHENDDLKDRGMSASLAFDPAPATGRGPNCSAR